MDKIKLFSTAYDFIVASIMGLVLWLCFSDQIELVLLMCLIVLLMKHY